MTKRIDSRQRARVFAALSDPTRLRIVELLAARTEMSGSEIADMLDISLALCCHHTKLLTESGIVRKRTDGQTKYCSLDRETIAGCLRGLLDTIGQAQV